MSNPGPAITSTPISSADMRVNPSVAASGDGHYVGLTALDLVGFFGATPIAQPAAISTVVTTAPATSSYGYTQAQAAAIISQLNLVITALTNLGIIA